MGTLHTDLDHLRLTAAFADQLRAHSDDPAHSLALDTAEQHEVAATLANVARRLGWTPPPKP